MVLPHGRCIKGIPAFSSVCTVARRFKKDPTLLSSHMRSKGKTKTPQVPKRRATLRLLRPMHSEGWSKCSVLQEHLSSLQASAWPLGHACVLHCFLSLIASGCSAEKERAHTWQCYRPHRQRTTDDAQPRARPFRSRFGDFLLAWSAMYGRAPWQLL